MSFILAQFGGFETHPVYFPSLWKWRERVNSRNGGSWDHTEQGVTQKGKEASGLWISDLRVLLLCKMVLHGGASALYFGELRNVFLLHLPPPSVPPLPGHRN